MECHVYYRESSRELHACCGPLTWVGSQFVLIGVFSFTAEQEPDTQTILEWSYPRLRLLEFTLPPKLYVINRATRSYWNQSL